MPETRNPLASRGLPTVSEHYERHLAECYGWMVGGPEAAIARGDAELSRLGVPASGSGRVLDLGAGFGTHAIPLAGRGYQVTAVDASATLLAQLRSLDAEQRVRTVEGGLLAALEGAAAGLALVLCMGDTLTHLEDRGSVDALVELAAERLAPGGQLLLTFRDYSRMSDGETRAFTVRSDDARIATCVLAMEGARIRVTDLLHEREGEGWSVRASHYHKVPLDPAAVEDSLRRAKLKARRLDGAMVTLVADRPATP